MTERILLPPDRTSPARAREWVRPLLAPYLDDDTEAVLCLSELVANAVIHAGTEVDVAVAARDGVVRLEVRDRAPADLPAARELTRWAVTGRGLLLVSQLADRWGVDTDEASKTVWFEVRAAGAPARSLASPPVVVDVPADAVALPAELDLASAASFRGVLDASITEGRELCLDGASLEFIDSTGVSVLVAAYQRCQIVGTTLRIVNASPPLVRTLETLGIADVLLGLS